MRTGLFVFLLLSVGIGTAGGYKVWRDRHPARVSEQPLDVERGAPTRGDPDVSDAVVVADSTAPLETSPTANGAAETADPVEVGVADAHVTKADGELDRPGGSSVPADGEARRQALAFVEQATKSTNAVEQARLLTKALRSGALEKTADEKAYSDLLEANKRGILNPRIADLCMTVDVKSGDSLWKICRRVRDEAQLHVEPGLVRLVNAMTRDSIYAGARLKVPSVPVSIVVEKRRFRLTVLLGDVMLKRYLVGLGKDDKTPEGDFTIATRQKDPTWFKPGSGPIPPDNPENVLGTRWLGFGKKEGFKDAETFGIHGTRDDASIGTEASNGCVRMHNGEVEELFEWIAEGVAVHIEA